MPIETPSIQPAEWLTLPVIATIVRLLCRELTLQSEYLRLENKILESRLPGPFRQEGKSRDISRRTIGSKVDYNC